MSLLHLRHTPILTYGSTVWWKGKRSHINKLAPLQNRALRLITGGFRTSPTNALEIDSPVPPIDPHLDYLHSRAATRLAKLPPNHPVVIRLPDTLGPTDIDTSRLPFKTPYSPPRRYRNLIRRQEAERRRLEQNAECMQLSKIATYVRPDVERINTLAEAPWHRSDFDTDLRERMQFKTPLTPLTQTSKKNGLNSTKTKSPAGETTILTA